MLKTLNLLTCAAPGVVGCQGTPRGMPRSLLLGGVRMRDVGWSNVRWSGDAEEFLVERETWKEKGVVIRICWKSERGRSVLV